MRLHKIIKYLIILFILCLSNPCFSDLPDESFNKNSDNLESSHGNHINIQTVLIIISIISSGFSIVLLYLLRKTQRLKQDVVRHTDNAILLAHKDCLTGLPNRRSLMDILDNLTIKNTHFALLFLDLDRFKFVNDVYGHLVGDKLLIQLAERLCHNVRTNEHIFRIGGDEFVIILKDLTEQVTVSDIVQRIIDRIKPLFDVDGIQFKITMSIGIAIYPVDGLNSQDILRAADLAMYSAKHSGRDNYAFFNSDLLKTTIEISAIEHDLRSALINEELTVNYQPQIRLSDMKLVGIEALLRWYNPILGSVPPNKFIPVAEDTGIICELGNFVIDTVCRQLVLWDTSDFRISINVSAIQLQRGDFYQEIKDTLDKYHVNPSHIELEITESVLIKDSKFMLNQLSKINKLGIRLAIDDFGIGYSNISYLKTIVIDTIKIDKAFIQDIHIHSNAVLVKAIIDMTSSLGALSIAEGVETRQQLDVLRELGCDMIQGFYISKALPTTYFENFYKDYMKEGSWTISDQLDK